MSKKPVSPILNCPRVEVIHFMGKNGGFATKDSELGRVQLIAHNEEPKSVMPWNEPHGLSRGSALELGLEWSKFLRWPIYTLEEVREVTVKKSYKLKEV